MPKAVLRQVVSNKIKIEKDCPMPSPSWYRHWPFNEMEIGDSFLVPEGRHKKARTAACTSAQRHGGKYTVRKTAEGYRCWRVA